MSEKVSDYSGSKNICNSPFVAAGSKELGIAPCITDRCELLTGHEGRHRSGNASWGDQRAGQQPSAEATQQSPCHICLRLTEMCCADCQINLRASVYVCATEACRDEHEKYCSGPNQQRPAETFQHRVHTWTLVCFGSFISEDKEERNHRFLEESLELVQSLGCTKSEAHQLVDYVFNRPKGDPKQECGGVCVTLAALCNANKLDMRVSGEMELERVRKKIDLIRAKQAAKPKHSPLSLPAQPPVSALRELLRTMRAIVMKHRENDKADYHAIIHDLDALAGPETPDA